MINPDHYYYYIAALIVLVLCIVCFFLYRGKGKKKKINDDYLESDKIQFPKKIYDKYNEISGTYLVYDIDGEEHYLTWRYAGQNKKEQMSYNLVLLPYQNKQNEFKIHLQDYHYLKKFYEEYSLYDDSMKDQLNEQVFATSEYNVRPEQYLELEKVTDNEYRVKASLWLEKGPNAYLHIDDKNKLYFDDGLHNNVIQFRIE